MKSQMKWYMEQDMGGSSRRNISLHGVEMYHFQVLIFLQTKNLPKSCTVGILLDVHHVGTMEY